MKQYPGYTLVKREDCPEQHGTLTVLTHDVSGAAVLLVENDDDNKAFGIGFGTFLRRHRRVPHPRALGAGRQRSTR